MMIKLDGEILYKVFYMIVIIFQSVKHLRTLAGRRPQLIFNTFII